MLGDFAAAATVAVKDLDKARDFYEHIVGLTPKGDALRGAQGYAAGASTVVVYESRYAGANQATSVTWALGGDFDVVMAQLKAKGVTFERYDIPDTTLEGDAYVHGKVKVAWFKDPDGNIINIGNYAP